MIFIIINAELHEVDKKEISYSEVLELAYPGTSKDKTYYSMTYRHGPIEKPEGILYLGRSVGVKSWMVFNTANTG